MALKVVYRKWQGGVIVGKVERSRWRITPFPFHVTVYTEIGPRYLGVTGTLHEAIEAIDRQTEPGGLTAKRG